MIIKWQEVKSPDDLPRTEEVFLAIWKGRICIAQFYRDTGCFYLSFEPAAIDQGDIFRIERDRINKFTHICLLTHPDAYPDELN